MADITVLKLDPETRDLCFDKEGIMEELEDGEAVAQNIRNNLLTWKGEFELNTDHGTDWSRVTGLPAGEANDEADDVVRSSIFQEPNVREIYELTPAIDGRSMAVAFSGTLQDGTPVSLEVKTE